MGKHSRPDSGKAIICPYHGFQLGIACPECSRSDTVLVCSEDGQVLEVTRAEAAAGMMRYARSLGPGTAACGVWERKALAMLRGEDWEVLSNG